MYRPRTLLLVAAILLAEAILVLVVPSRIPRPARAVTAAANLIAIAVLGLAVRQLGRKR